MAGAFFYPYASESLPQKILFLGDESIGKTTFLQTFCDHMRDYYRCESYRGSFLVFTQFLFYHSREEKRIPVQLLDLPAGTTAESRRDQYPAEVNMIVLCFAVDNPNSFSNIFENWFIEFRQYYSNSTRYYLLGLRNDKRQDQNATLVTKESAIRVHRDCAFSGEYMECSTIGDNEEVVNLMNTLIDEMFANERSNNAP